MDYKLDWSRVPVTSAHARLPGTRCAYRGGGRKDEHNMGLGNGGPHVGSALAVCLAEQFVRLRGKLFSAAECSGVRSLVLQSSRCPVLD